MQGTDLNKNSNQIIIKWINTSKPSFLNIKANAWHSLHVFAKIRIEEPSRVV